MLLMAGIGAAYSFDRLVDSPVRALPPWLLFILGGSFVLCAGTIFFLLAKGEIGSDCLSIVAVLSAVSMLYQKLKRIPLAKTAVVSISWIWACSTLPLSRGEPHRLSLDVTFPLLLLISAGCILCDLKDMTEDRKARIPTLPALLGTDSSCLVATGMALLAASLAFLHHRFGITAGALLLTVAAQFPTILAMKSFGPIMVDSILTIPGILIATGVV